MKKAYEVAAAVLCGLMIVAVTYFLLIPSLAGIAEKLTILATRGAQTNVQTNQPAKISTVQEPAVPTIQVSIDKTTPAPSGKNLSISNLIPNPSFSSNGANKSLPVLTFGKKNTIVFRDVVTAQSVSKLQSQLIAMSHNLTPSEPIYLVLDTPGGSVDAGLSLVDTAKGLPQEVKTVTFFAASMGYHIVESLGERLIVPSGTLMSHRVRVEGIAGQVPGEAVTRLNQLIRLTNEMDTEIAKRIGMSLKDYQALIQDEYWVQGDDSVKERMADRVVLGRCGADLNGTYTQKMMTLFGAMSVTWSECPLISAPLEVDAGDIFRSVKDPSKRAEILLFINTYVQNKRQFTLKYIVNREYTKILAE